MFKRKLLIADIFL